MRTLILLGALMVSSIPAQEYRVEPIDNREVVIICEHGTRPQISTVSERNNIVEIKCVTVP